MSGMPVSLCIAGGGTGGHVFPALALADAARSRWPQLEVTFIGAERGLEARLLPERGEQAMLLTMHSVSGAGVLQKLQVLLWELPCAVLGIWRHWRSRRPQLVVGVGGYASVAGVLAAVVRGIPVVLYEQNAVPGMVNRKLVWFCRRIMLGFADAARWLPQGKTCFTGNLVAGDIRSVCWQAHEPPRLLVLGGSQGAQVFNEILPQACGLLREDGYIFAVTHVAGSDDRVQPLMDAYADTNVEAQVLGFCHDMPALYAAADLLVARAGAMTVCEAAVVGLPSIFVPLPQAADNHQFHNAKSLAETGAAGMLEQHDLNASMLAAKLKELLFDMERLSCMSEAALAAQPQNSEQRMLEVLGYWLEVPA